MNVDGYSAGYKKGWNKQKSRSHDELDFLFWTGNAFYGKEDPVDIFVGSGMIILYSSGVIFVAHDVHHNFRVNVTFGSADTTLNGVARVELDPKLAEQFELFDYGSGRYAIGFKDGKVPGKLTSANLSLNIWLEGNETAKANATAKLKLTFVR